MLLLTESGKIRELRFSPWILLIKKIVINLYTYFSISGKFVLVWQRGDDVLTAQSIMVSPDKRYKLLPDHTLEIRKITPNDGGDYSCKISVLGEPIEIRHTLEILRKSFSYFAGFLFFFAHWPDIENRILANAVNFSSFCKQKRREILFLEYQLVSLKGKFYFKTQF